MEPVTTPLTVTDPPDPATRLDDLPVHLPATSHGGAPVVVKSVPTRAVTLQSIAAQALLAFSAIAIGFLVFVVTLSALPEQCAQTGLQRRFSTALADVRAAIGGQIPRGTPVARLDVPRLGLHQVVVEGTTADQLRKGPGHLAVSPLPGQPGNAVIAAHRVAWGGPFADLGRLHGSDTIDILTGQGRFTYRVTGQHQVGANDVRPFRATEDNRLTLVTAANLDASRRLVVEAQLVGSPQAAPTGRPSVLAASEGGLVGQDGALSALGWWLQVLLIVTGATVLLYRYRPFPFWSNYLITTPVVLAALWLVYENLARLLPATQ